MANRRRFEQSKSFKDRLEAFRDDLRARAATAAPVERDNLLRRARQADTAAHLDEWANSGEFRPPR